MAYRGNPFLERMSERTVTDQEFVQLFSPKILERLDENCLDGAVHLFCSPPGGGKTTILRAFTPNALRAFWHARRTQSEAYRQLIDRGALDETGGPQLLGVFLSCAAGYADLPPGASAANEGMFRALLDCRIILRTLRSFAELVGKATVADLDGLRLEYDPMAHQLTAVPLGETATEMLRWAERREREVYGQLDAIASATAPPDSMHVRLEGLLWLQSVRFVYNGSYVAPKRLLMIDDIQKLRKTQRTLLLDELVGLRLAMPVWLSSRRIAFADSFLSQGVRDGRDIREYSLEELWSGGRSTHHFASFAENILDRRFAMQTAVPGGSFSQYLSDDHVPSELQEAYDQARAHFQTRMSRLRSNIRYREWLAKADTQPTLLNADALIDLYVTRILIARDEARRQLSLELAPLSIDELEERDSSAVTGAAEIYLFRELRVPYYFGVDRLCSMATSNVEELLSLAAALYEGMRAKQVLRRQAQPQLLPREQEKRIREAAARKVDFIPRNHSEGTRAQRLLDAIGIFCRDKTFQATAPYAPGVTGVRLATSELSKLECPPKGADRLLTTLKHVLFECVAENLLTTRESSSSVSREGGTVLYLNRTLCAHYGLPLQYGGWQDIPALRLAEWMEEGLQPSRDLALEAV